LLVGYHASHEQHPPAELLDFVRLAEEAGFGAAMCSDHIEPFTERHGNSGFAWSWLGAAMQATALPFGVVTTPGWRYHPAVLAQAIATLGGMFPGRLWVALGSGEQLNEHVVARRWPSKAERNEVLRASHGVIARLLAGEIVSETEPVAVEEARIWVHAEPRPLLVGAAITEATARWLGSWADALITPGGPTETIRRVVRAFRDGGGTGKPVFLQAQHSFAATDAAARAAAHENWRVSVVGSGALGELRTPAQLDAATAFVREEDVAARVRCSANPEQHLEWLREYHEIGFDAVYVHNVQRDDRRFIECFGERVLPEARRW
jgi:probable non-F420 flavinoid oxidoreductase